MRYLLLLSFIVWLGSCDSEKKTPPEASTPAEQDLLPNVPSEYRPTPPPVEEPAPTPKPRTPAEGNPLKPWLTSFLTEYDAVDYIYPRSQDSLWFVSKSGLHGIVNSSGKAIVRMEWDELYAPNDLIEGWIEVRKGNQLGLAALDGSLRTLPATYRHLVPTRAGLYGITLKGEVQKIVDKGGQLATEASDYTTSAVIAKARIGIDENRTNPCVIKTSYSYDYGFGVYLTPSFFRSFDGFPEIIEPFPLPITPKESLQEVPEFPELANYSAQPKPNVIDRISTFVMDFFTEGVGVRDSYGEKQSLLAVMPENGTEITGQITLITNERKGDFCEGTSVSILDSSGLVQVIDYPWGYAGYNSAPRYQYYQIDAEGRVTKLTTHRTFAQSKYRKLTQAEFKGCFVGKEPESMDERGIATYFRYQHMSVDDLDRMRNEIFAEYGYRFKNERWKNIFEEQDWYRPQYDNVDDQLTEIDRYNIQLILQRKEKLLQDPNNLLRPETFSFHFGAG